ncbi:hypothetical protein [Micromonospora sp. WMMD712]|uniref:hypothetical protein n=1 Tax=Micromonospora sp. WMMD712 TaxID=3016096 RepID=UPI00249AB4ED|nr:hypothetical protein [Micromonospora sp. WMMD712]WFE59932.1 hypothetical protein O7633_25150 [Micromonospora sp. WMMD712]
MGIARRVCALLLTAAALLGAVRLVVPATAGPDGEPPGVARQLAFLRAALDDGAGEDAQALFPEGWFFAHALYGLACVELGLRKPAGQRAGELREARWALARLESPAGTAPFDPGLTPAYGIFWQGWTNWLRGGVVALQPAERRDPAEVARFADASAAIGAAFDASGTPYLAAYPGQAWPVDSTVAVASLRLHDALLPAAPSPGAPSTEAPPPPRFAGTVARWLDGVRQRLDPRTGLLPHRVDPATGAPAEVARATSQSVIQRFLVDVDPAFARAQYLTFRERFVASPLGLGPAVREYPDGTAGPGDVDSGPLLLGVSLSATVVTLGAAQSQGDAALAGALANYGDLVGLPVDTPATRRYAFGVLPVGDAFLAWSKTARPWVADQPDPPPATVRWWWRLPLLAALLLVGALGWLPELVRSPARAARRRGATRRPRRSCRGSSPCSRRGRPPWSRRRRRGGAAAVGLLP